MRLLPIVTILLGVGAFSGCGEVAGVDTATGDGSRAGNENVESPSGSPSTPAPPTACGISRPWNEIRNVTGAHFEYLDGAGKGARLVKPWGAVADAAGNFYFSEIEAHTIRKVDPAGVVTTIAGRPGVPGSADGSGASARFDGPAAMVPDGLGNLLVADIGNHTVRKVDATGAVTTFLGLAGAPGSTDGSASEARFDSPYAMATDGRGTLFIVDGDANPTRIRKVDLATGNVTTAYSGFLWILAMTADHEGNLYFTGRHGDASRLDLATGTSTTLVPPPPEKVGRIGAGGGIAIDETSGDLYLSRWDDVVKVHLSTGALTHVADENVPAIATDDAGHLYLANNEVRRMSLESGAMVRVAGAAAPERWTSSNADGPRGVARLLWADNVTPDSNGSAYFVTRANETGIGVRKVDLATGDTSFVAGGPGSDSNERPVASDGVGSEATFTGITAMVAVGADLYVAEPTSLRKINVATRAVTLVAGSWTEEGTVDGSGKDARFKSIAALVHDGADNLYAADGSTLRKIDIHTFQVTTFGGDANDARLADGIGRAARFATIEALSYDCAGHLAIGESARGSEGWRTASARVVTLANGDVKTVTQPVANLRSVSAVDGAGNLYFWTHAGRIGEGSLLAKLPVGASQPTFVAGRPAVAGISLPFPSELPGSVDDLPGHLTILPNGEALFSDPSSIWLVR